MFAYDGTAFALMSHVYIPTIERLPVSLAVFVDVDLLEHHQLCGGLDVGVGKVHPHRHQESH